MNSQVSQHEEEQIVSSIIFAFQGHILPRIGKESVWQDTVGLLSANLLEQFSGFLFAGPTKERTQRFVETYMPKYKDLGLYGILKNALAYDLFEKLEIVIPIDSLPKIGRDSCYPEYRRIMDAFVSDLEAGISMAADDLRNDQKKREHAILWFQDHPVRLLERRSWFSDEEMWKLTAYYMPLLEEHMRFAVKSRLSIGLNFGEKGYLVNVLIDDFGDREESVRLPLELFIGLLELEQPAKVLGW